MTPCSSPPVGCPNGDQLDAHAAGIELGRLGNVVVDGYGRTSAPGVWALGDVNGRYQLKHMANGEAKTVQHNLLHPDDLQPLDTRPAPHAVFGSPQIGAVGLTEAQAEALGRPFAVISHPYGDTAYGWALEDTTGFCKLIGDPATRTLLGAHVIGYQASMLVQLLVQGMHLGHTVDELAHGQVWIHPALSEVVEQALLKLLDCVRRGRDFSPVSYLRPIHRSPAWLMITTSMTTGSSAETEEWEHEQADCRSGNGNRSGRRSRRRVDPGDVGLRRCLCRSVGAARRGRRLDH